MCQGAWTINMQTNNIVHQHRRNYNSEFLRETPRTSPIFKDIRTVLFLLKATGLLPLYEHVSEYEIAPPTKLNEFYSLLIRGVIYTLTAFHVYYLFTPSSSQLFYSLRDTDNVNKWIELLLCIITYIAALLICSKNSKSFVQIINDILKVDEEVQQQFGTTFTNICGFTLKFIIGICICHWYLIILRMLVTDEALNPISYFFIGFQAMQNGIATTFIIFTAALLRIAKIRFAYLNLILNGYTYTQQRKVRRLRRVGEVAAMELFPEDALFTFRMHNRMLRIFKSINESCSLILVSYMGYAFYTITTTTYNLFVQITTQRIVSMNALQWCFAWLCMHTSLLALLSKCCGEITKEANRTSQILARVYGKSKDYQNIFTLYAILVLVVGLLEIRLVLNEGEYVTPNFHHDIFSAVTTYLVILIQFKQLEDSKLEDQDVSG